MTPVACRSATVLDTCFNPEMHKTIEITNCDGIGDLYRNRDQVRNFGNMLRCLKDWDRHQLLPWSRYTKSSVTFLLALKTLITTAFSISLSHIFFIRKDMYNANLCT